MKTVWALLRIGLGLQLLWAFFDKLFGLGFSTELDKAWIAGSSPTAGFLKFGATGPFAPFYNRIGGTAIVDWLFMLALLLIGLALVLGIGMKIASISGAVLYFLMWTAVLPKENNLFGIDDHVINIVVLIGFMLSKAGRYAGLGNWWSRTKLVNKCPFLE